MARGVSEDEKALLDHVMMFGSDGYPIQKVRGGWLACEFRSIRAVPKVFKTKRDALAQVELFLGILRDAKTGRI